MRSNSAAFALSLVLASTALPTWGGDGHDHGDAPPAANSNGPRRLPDGSVFLPKQTQHQIGVRTVMAKAGELARTFELAGKVVMDPNAGGKVQALVAGRLESGPQGFPSVGQRVKKGDVLAYVVPASSPLERATQTAQLAELRAALVVAEQRVVRLRELVDTVPRRDIEAAESDRIGLTERVLALRGGLSGRDALVSPVSGVVASSNAVAGQVVDSRELVFEVVDPTRLRVEALAYDGAVAADIAGASIGVGMDSVSLVLVGASRSLREQALPLMFRSNSPQLSRLVVGQPLKVYVQSRSKVSGFSVPSASLMKDPANQTVVWVKTAPERFEPRVVTIAPLDGANVAVTSGLKPGERVVSQAATLVNQVR